MPHELVGLFNLRMMPTVVQHDQLRARNRGMIDLSGAQGDDGVLPSPDDERRELPEPAEQRRQRRIMHIGPPTQTAGFLARHLPGFSLLGCGGVGTDFLKLWRVGGVEIADRQILLRHLQEHVIDLPRGRPNSHGTDQHQLFELPWTHRGHLGRQPSAERKANRRHRPQPQVIQGIEIPTSHIPHVRDPVQSLQPPKAGMEWNIEGMLLSQGLVKVQPAWMSQLIMQDQQWRAAATLDELKPGAGHLDDLFSPGFGACRHRYASSSFSSLMLPPVVRLLYHIAGSKPRIPKNFLVYSSPCVIIAPAPDLPTMDYDGHHRR